jgi:capsular polysaccharide transport system permease protein
VRDQVQQKNTGVVTTYREGAEVPPRKPKNLRLLEALLEPPVVAPEVKPAVAPGEQPSPDAKAEKSKGFLSRHKPRHIVMISAFLLIVALPVALTTLYMAFIANDQYHSSASFSVRSIETAQASDVLGMFTQNGAGTTAADSYVLLDFIRSERMVKAIDSEFGMENLFARRGLDFFYGIGSDWPIEDKLDYWRSMITVSYDYTSGIIDLKVKAFTPHDSQTISSFIISQSERLINDLSLAARNEVLKVSQTEVELAEARLSAARVAVRNYRDSSQEADPVESAKLAAQIVGSLEQQLVQLKTELATALTQIGENTPRVRVMRSQIASIEKQLEREKQRFGAGAAQKQGRASPGISDVARRIQQFETLETEREFAERTYTSALASLEKARIEANGKQRYLAVFIQPTLSELAQYPTRLLNIAIVLLGSLLLWGVGVMGYYNIRDRN